MPDVIHAPSDADLKRVERIWSGLSRQQCEGVLLMTEIFPPSEWGIGAIRDRALWAWHQFGAEIQKPIAVTMLALIKALR